MTLPFLFLLLVVGCDALCPTNVSFSRILQSRKGFQSSLFRFVCVSSFPMEEARKDGRAQREIRETVVERGLLKRADGSSRWRASGTQILAAVHGPRWGGGAESAEGLVVELSVNGLDKSDEEALKGVLQRSVSALEHPRSNCLVAVEVEADDGAALAFSCNAALAAMMDAGVAVAKPCTAAAVSVLEGGARLLDPTSEEQAKSRATVVSAFSTRWRGARLAPLSRRPRPGAEGN